MYVAIVATTVLAIGFYAGDAAWPAAFAVGAGAFLVSVVAAMLLWPRFRHLRDATAVAESFAAGRFGARAEVSDDEFAPLGVALNAAGANIERVVSALRQERAQLEALLNASSDATVAVDDNANIVYLNDAARSMFGQDDRAVTGRPFIEVVRDHDLNELIVAAARQGERSVRVVPYGSAQRWLQATAVAIEGAETWAALAVFHDLTEVRRLDSMRRDFISNVSHELRTPLAGIRAAAETLSEGALDDKPAAIEFLGHIQRETDRMTQMVEELLELSRIESGAVPLQFAQLDAGLLVQDTVRRFAQQAERAHITLCAEVPVEQLTVIGDHERLERALGNFVANALKFTPARGEVTVRAEADGNEAAISVVDSGIGIEADQQGRVFERFFKADRGRGSEGIGLGLAIVKHIVRAHEGTVAVESRPGRGSTFTMRLPRR